MKKILSLIITGFLLFCSQADSANATALKFSPEVIDLTAVGTIFEVSVVIEGVTALQGFEFDIIYDASVVSANKVVSGNFMTGSVIALGPTIVYGKFTYGATSIGSGSTGTGTLAIITFTKKSETCANKPLQFGNVTLFNSSQAAITPELHNAEFTAGCACLSEAIMILKLLCNIDIAEENISACKDVNGDGKIGIEEVFNILRKLVM